MKTIIPAAITNVAEAKAFLTDLHNNNEIYHPEDGAAEVLAAGLGGRLFTDEEE